MTHPNVDLEIAASARYVDLAADGIDVAMRFGHWLYPRLVARKLPSARLNTVASPGYLQTHGRPSSPKDCTPTSVYLGSLTNGVEEQPGCSATEAALRFCCLWMLPA